MTVTEEETSFVQHRDDGDFIYITIQDPKYIVDGNWTVAYSTEKYRNRVLCIKRR